MSSPEVTKGLATVERMLFDSCGYLVLKKVFTKEEISELDSLFDRYADEFVARNEGVATARSDFFKGNSGRSDYGKVLQRWTQESSVCASIFEHPRLNPVIEEICGKGFRLDHFPLAFEQNPGGEGFDLHGGRLLPSGDINFPVAYTSVDNTSVHTSLLAVSIAVSDMAQGAGGFVALPGSHKCSFPATDDILHARHPAVKSMMVQPGMEAGDVLVFTEALMHGTLPWKGTHTRRTLLFRFGPATCAYARGYLCSPAEIAKLNLSETAKEMLLPPYHSRYDRAVASQRSEEQLDYDRKVFGQPYY
ncbi:hypothetical protein Pmar_PMAR006448 [Perkinsus marinus ATCC 50983]|uniref:Phytanoyl-CoA dioxygenase n=1 Tax=Perkinsus marinus (strain ATCC 50983 / TXsc) TaxID=423536 RepID=C5K9Q2_PERM5|nr:hypothetical protein Pmar_PMAR006448 [Perkinsus marinus ATCC 50983]EER18824.1 hypothetical protein Pmar_PMAR006448 [Perkinsus marinus ATCC 50983]|eukprot:XP_002787028.1 hypothetical protein Pmar_PMAR006448 [Perkinsus marinus ATCC 50983]